MQNDLKIDLQTHLARITEAVEELLPLGKRYAAPAHESVQFLGTIVDNTIGLLTAPANSIDQGNRRVQFSDTKNWLSLMQAVHRSFFSSIHIATEAGLTNLCKEMCLTVEISAQARVSGIIKGMGDKLTEKDRRLISSLASKSAQFSDYLEAVVSNLMSPDDAKTWRRYFRALSIVRNKVSHSDSTLTVAEIGDLNRGGFAATITDGELRVNPRMYKQVCEHIAQFFHLVVHAGEKAKSKNP